MTRPSLTLTVALAAALALPSALTAQEAPVPVPVPPAPVAPEAAPTPAPDSAPAPCEGTWIAESAEASDVTLAEAPLAAPAQVTGEAQQVLAFRVTADSQPVRIEARSEMDPALELRTAEGDLIAENDDFGQTLNARIEQALGPGDYCVALRSAGGGEMAAEVQVARDDQPALLGDAGEAVVLADCTPDTPADPLGEGPLDAAGSAATEYEGGAAHYFRFKLDQPMPLTLRASSTALDAQLRLFDGTGALVAENDDFDLNQGTDARVDRMTPLPEGDYCLAVSALTPADGTITVSAERLDPAQLLRDAHARGEVPPGPDSSYPVTPLELARTGPQVVLHDGSAQWLDFTLDTETVLIINAYGALLGADTRLALFAADGALVAENDDIDGRLDARVGPVVLAPGRYALALTDLGRSTEGEKAAGNPGGTVRAILLSVERFLRAP